MPRTPQSAQPLALLLALLWLTPVEASSRWDILRWCSAETAADAGRCEGILGAALDLTTHADFAAEPPTPALCFAPGLTLLQLRATVVAWLRDNPIAEQRSGLALVRRAIQTEFGCSH